MITRIIGIMSTTCKSFLVTDLGKKDMRFKEGDYVSIKLSSSSYHNGWNTTLVYKVENINRHPTGQLWPTIQLRINYEVIPGLWDSWVVSSDYHEIFFNLSDIWEE